MTDTEVYYSKLEDIKSRIERAKKLVEKQDYFMASRVCADISATADSLEYLLQKESEKNANS